MGDGPDMEAGVRSLLEINGLSYRMTPGMSVATSRVTREWNAIRSTYGPGEVLSVPISSGAAYVDPDNSYLTFIVRIRLKNGGGRGNNLRFFWGSDRAGRQNCLNLFKDMRLTHSSGYEIDRITRGFGPWKYIQNAYTKDQEWHDTVGSLMRGVQLTQQGTDFYLNDGAGPTWGRTTPPDAPQAVGDAAANARALLTVDLMPDAGHEGTIGKAYLTQTMRPFGSGTADDTIDIRCIVPLSCISGVWDNDMLSPSFLMAGARLDMTMQDKTQVWQVRSADGAAINPALDWDYTIEQPKMVLETITFTDAVLRALSMSSANTGLEIPFIAMHYSNAPIQVADMSIQINRGLSRANMIVVRMYPNKSNDNSDRCAMLDSNAAYWVQPDTQGWQAKLGAEFMPAIPITDSLQIYHAVQTAFGNWKADRRNTVKMVDFVGGQDFGPAHGTQKYRFCPYATLGVLAMTLEKSSTLSQSGSPVSAARDLNVVFGSPSLLAYTDAAVWGGLAADVYVPHVTLATVFLDSVLTRS